MSLSNSRSNERTRREQGRSDKRSEPAKSVRDVEQQRLKERRESRAQMNSNARINAEVRDARALVKGFDPDRVNDKTKVKYHKAVDRMSAKGTEPKDARCKNSFELERAALVYVAQKQLKSSLSELDLARTASDGFAVQEARQKVQALTQTLQKYPPTSGNREEDLQRKSAYNGPSRADSEHSTCKRSSALDLPADWQGRLLTETHLKDRPAVAVMALTGCRPAEVKGIKVRHSADKDSLEVTIKGAKVDDDRGIKSRTLTFQKSDLERTESGREILGWIGNREVRTVTHEGMAKAFCNRVNRAANRADLPDISAYTLRHNKAHELKAARTPRDEIANRLGHRSDRSQTCYG